MLTATREEYDALTRIDFNVFVERVFHELEGSAPYLDNFHIAMLCAELEAVRAGQQRRLAIALPPRSLKSIIVSIAFPAWLLGHNPETRIICASYGQQLAEDLARDCRQVMRSDWYRHLFPATRLKGDRQAVSNFETTAGGSRHATSVGGVLTGFGADVIIVDDPTKPEEAFSDVERAKANAWVGHTLFTRLNDKAKGAIILVMQRLHEEDMIGYLLDLFPTRVLAFPAIAQEDETFEYRTPFGIRRHSRREGEALHPDREPLAVLEEMRKVLGSRFFAAQYLQMPTAPGGNIVKEEWFQRYSPADLPIFDYVLQSWDTANRASQLSDYSVCTTWGIKGKQAFLLSVFRKKLEFPDLKRAVREQAMVHGASTILIEDCVSGTQLIQDLRNENVAGIIGIKPKGDKIMRLSAQTPKIEAGLVFIPHHAAWLEDYLHEVTIFPTGKYDDQVDSTSQALGHLSTPYDGFFAMIAEELERKCEPQWIRIKHIDGGMQFQLINGRNPPREPDGSFLVTKEEYAPIAGLPGLTLVGS